KAPRRGATMPELTRFLAEAQLLARLHHPGIVPVYEVGGADGRLFLVMEYCPGGSLADRLDGTPLPPRTAATLAEELARAGPAARRSGGPPRWRRSTSSAPTTRCRRPASSRPSPATWTRSA